MTSDAYSAPTPLKISTDYILAVDLEATCDAKGFPRDQRETIEIGAVLVETHTWDPGEEDQAFIRPVRHPRLTAYCVDLTTFSNR